MIRTQLVHRMRQNAWTTLIVTSPGNAEGKTLTAVNLAIGLAMEPDQSVLLPGGTPIDNSAEMLASQRMHLEALSRAETSAYIQHRLSVAAPSQSIG
jgi:hypothetical protein